MSEEEIIKIIKYMLENKNTDINVIINYEAIQGLLDLYKKEKEDYKKFRKDIVDRIMIWDKEELPYNEAIIETIDTLMGEVSRLEDIEDKKVEVAVDCIEEKRDKFWKDKIGEKLNYFENSFDYDDDGTSYELVMKVLEELLEENK